MKLSQLSTGELAPVLCRLTPPVCRIAQDEAVLAAFDRAAFDGRSPLSAAAQVWETLLPRLLSHHPGDLMEVLSVLTGKSADALRGQSALHTLADLRAVWDGDLSAFFTSAGASAQEKS